MHCERTQRRRNASLLLSLASGLSILASLPQASLASGTESPAVEPPVVEPARVEVPTGHPPISVDLTGDFRALTSRRTLLTLAAGGALTAMSLRLDDPGRAAALFDRGPFEAPSDVGNRYGDTSTLAAGAIGLFAIGALTGKDNLRLAGWDLTRSLLYSGAAVWAVKLAVSRTRPNGGPYSFPSGHAAAAFAAAPVLASHFGIAAVVPAYALAASVALGRMEDRKHYLSDVVFGATIGLAAGTSVVRSSAARSSLNFGITPDGVACSVRF